LINGSGEKSEVYDGKSEEPLKSFMPPLSAIVDFVKGFH